MGFPTVLIPGIFIKFFLNKREFSSNPYIYIFEGRKFATIKKGRVPSNNVKKRKQ